ncbi:MAG: BatD family protein [Bacteroidales bacterium]|nr:BatD family protein [Bacteroidales bacterium]
MKKQFTILTLLILCFGLLKLDGQNISFNTFAPQIIGVGEQFQVRFTINTDDVSIISFPQFSSFDILSGPQTSTSSSYSMINGKTTSEKKTTFSFVLQANKEGDFSLGGAKVKSDGKIYTSNTIKIKVQKEPTQQQRSQNRRTNNYNQQYNNSNQNTRGEKVTKVDENTLFIKAYPNKTTAYVGEEIIITYKLYTLVPISEFQVNKMPTNKGFWIEELDLSQDPTITKETINGKTYQVATLRKVIAYPQEEGKLNIAPLDIDAVAHIQSSRQRQVRTGDPFFDSFFNDPFFQSMGQMGYERVKKNIKSNSITIDAKALPQTNENFSGGVGNFSLNASINPLQCKTNEAITLRYTISGAGNLSLIDKIDVNIPENFDAYDPTIEDNINKGQQGVSGKRTFQYIIIPRIKGEYTIPKLNFTYFDIKTKQYKTISSQEFKLNISQGKEELSSFQRQLNEKEQYLKKDITSIQTNNTELINRDEVSKYYNPTLIFFIILMPSLTFAYIIIRNRIRKKNSDISYVKYKKATKVAIKRLKKAKTYLVNNKEDDFYSEIAKAVWNYLEDRFHLVKMDLNFDNVRDTLKKKNIDDDTINNMITLLNNCEYVRFSQKDENKKMENLYKEAMDSLSDIESQIK